MINYSTLDTENSKGIYLVVSLDYYSVEQVVNKFTQKLSYRELNHNKIDLKQIKDINELKSFITTYPMMDDLRVIVFDNLDPKSKLYKEFLKIDIPKYTKIIIPYYIVRRDNIKKDKVIQAIEKHPYAEVIYQKIDKKRVDELTKSMGLKLEQGIIDKLITLDNMDVIKNDLAKIASIIEDDANLINKIISKSNEIDMFDLIESISCKDLSQSISILNEIRDKGENDVGIAIRLRNKFRELYMIKQYVMSGMKSQDIAYKIGCHPYVATLGIAAVKKFDVETLENAYISLAECEDRYKSGYKNDLLTTTLIQILSY